MVLTNKQVRYFELAKNLSKKSDHYRHKLGCIIVNHNKIIGLGFNLLRTHSKSPNRWKTIHSEFHAILGVDPADLYGATVYVYREHRNGTLAIAKPCPTCNKMLQDCSVREVIYTTEGSYNSYRFY
jgi:deoxycytidylate deaminase